MSFKMFNWGSIACLNLFLLYGVGNQLVEVFDPAVLGKKIFEKVVGLIEKMLQGQILLMESIDIRNIQLKFEPIKVIQF